VAVGIEGFHLFRREKEERKRGIERKKNEMERRGIEGYEE